MLHYIYGARWCRCGFSALQPERPWFESTSTHCVMTLDKLLTHNCLWGRKRETTSLISPPGGVKANEPAFGQRTIITLHLCHKAWLPLGNWLLLSAMLIVGPVVLTYLRVRLLLQPPEGAGIHPLFDFPSAAKHSTSRKNRGLLNFSACK